MKNVVRYENGTWKTIREWNEETDGNATWKGGPYVVSLQEKTGKIHGIMNADRCYMIVRSDTF